MELRIVGQPWGTPAQPKDKYSEDAERKVTITSTYRTLYVGWLGTAPNLGSAHSLYPKARLVTRDAEQMQNPGYLCEVTLKYESAKGTGINGNDDDDNENTPPEPGAQLPPDRYAESSSDLEFPIEAHPDFAAFGTPENGAIFGPPTTPPLLYGKFKGWAADSPYAGYKTYKAGSVTESITTYSWGKPVSVSTDVGKRSGSGGKWLVVSGSIAKEGLYWSRTLNRLYNANGWNPVIYPNT